MTDRMATACLKRRVHKQDGEKDSPRVHKTIGEAVSAEWCDMVNAF